MTESIGTLLCRECGNRKLRDDIREDFGMASNGESAGGLCTACAVKFEAERAKVPAAFHAAVPKDEGQ
jgi:hypothetical protein